MEEAMYVLARETYDEDVRIDGYEVFGITTNPHVVEAWQCGSGHAAYAVELDGAISEPLPACD